MEKVVIFGASKMAELAYIYFTKDKAFDVAAFTIDREYVKEDKFLGLPLVPFEEIEKRYSPQEYAMFVAIGYRKLNTLRKQKYNAARDKGYKLVSYVCSKITNWGDLQIGDNCFIFENQVIQPGVKIGDDVIIWSGNHFGHDVKIGNHCFVASHSVLSGGVEVGDYSFIGINATVRDNVKIGRECIIGAGAIILSNVKDRSVYAAEPTKRYPLDSEKFEKLMDISFNTFKK